MIEKDPAPASSPSQAIALDLDMRCPKCDQPVLDAGDMVCSDCVVHARLEAADELAALRQEHARVNQEAQRYFNDWCAEENRAEALEAEVATLRAERDAIEHDLKNDVEDYFSLKSRVEAAESARDTARALAVRLEHELAASREHNEKLFEQWRNDIDRIAELRQQLRETESRLAEKDAAP